MPSRRGLSRSLTLALCVALVLPAAADDLPTSLPDDAPPAQEEALGPPLRFEGSLMAALSAPLGHNPDVAGFGFAVTYGMGWGEIPLSLGVDFMSIGSIGDTSDKLELSIADAPVSAERVTHTRLLHLEGYLRLQPAHWRVRPYVEGFYGTQQYQAKYVLRVPVQGLQSDPVSGSEWVHSYGWGAGLEIVGLLNRSGTMSLTLGMRRVHGGTAELTRPATLADQTFDVQLRAGTASLLFMIGIAGHYDLSQPPPESEFLGE